MKWDKLKSFIVRYNGEFIRAYKETEVDEAIEELKDFIEDACLERDDNQAAIDELNAELESLKATHYTESVDSGMENRRLKRALWIARAERAHLKVLEYWPDYCHNAHCRIAEQKWDNVERKCRAKAEEYK